MRTSIKAITTAIIGIIMVLGTLASGTTPVKATLITIVFGGTLQSFGAEFSEPPPFAIGDAFSATVVFDVDAPNVIQDTTNPEGNHQVTYRAITSLEVRLGSYVATAPAADIIINDNPSDGTNVVDAWSIDARSTTTSVSPLPPFPVGLTGPSVAGLEVGNFLISLQGLPDVFSNADLVAPPVELLTAFRRGFLDFGVNGNVLQPGNVLTRSSIASITIITTPVPEPSTLALFLTGLAGLGFMMRRRRRST